MPSLFSTALEAGMRDNIADTVIEGCRTAEDEADYLGLNGVGNTITSKGKGYPIWLTHNAAGGYMAEGGNYPVAGGAGLGRMRAFITTYVFTAAYTGRFLRLVDHPDVMIDGTKEYMERDRRIILDNKAQDMFGDGSGEKGVVASVSGGVVTCAVTSAAGYFGAMKFMEGERLNFINPATNQPRAGGGPTVGTIDAGGVDNPNVQITLAGTAGTNFPNDIAPGDRIVRENSFGQAITGLLRAVNNDSLDFQGLNRGKFKKTRSTVHDVAGEVPHFNNLNVLKYRMRVRGTKKTKRDLVTSIPIAQAIEQQGHALRRYTETSNTVEFDFDKFRIDGSEGMAFLYCQADNVYSLDRSEIEFNVMTPLGVVDTDGTIFHMAPTSNGGHSDNFLVYYKEEADLGYKNLRNLGRSTGYDLTGLDLPCYSADL